MFGVFDWSVEICPFFRQVQNYGSDNTCMTLVTKVSFAFLIVFLRLVADSCARLTCNFVQEYFFSGVCVRTSLSAGAQVTSNMGSDNGGTGTLTFYSDSACQTSTGAAVTLSSQTCTNVLGTYYKYVGFNTNVRSFFALSSFVCLSLTP